MVNLGSHPPTPFPPCIQTLGEKKWQVARWILKIIGDSGKLYKPSFEMSVYCLAKIEGRAREVKDRGVRGTFF